MSGLTKEQTKKAEALKKKGNDAFEAKNYALAVKGFSEALEIDPTNETYYSNRAAAYTKMEQYDLAIADGKKCVELKPEWGKGYARQGLALFQKGDYAGAVAIYALGIAKDPSNTSLTDGLSQAQKKLAAQKSGQDEKKGTNQKKPAKKGGGKKAKAKKVKKKKAEDAAAAVATITEDLKAGKDKVEKKGKVPEEEKAPEKKKAEGDIVIGIDLGTTYSCVGVWEDEGVKIIPNKEGDKTIPSYVSFKKNGERLVGQGAKDRATTHPKQTIFDVKRIIGQRFTDPGVAQDIRRFPFAVTKGPENKPLIEVDLEGGGTKSYACEEISAMVLTELKGIAEGYLGQTITKAVITVPAYFNDAQRTATKAAGVIAGLDVLRIINEPTAAALSYGLDIMAKKDEATNVLIFDLGGGTFDVSILSIEGGIFTVKATGGDTHLGGEDFDNAVIDYLILEAEKQGIPDPRDNPRSLRRLRNAAEKAKRALSQAGTAAIVLDNLHQDKGFNLTLERGKFESLNKGMFNVCLDTVKHVLKDAKLKTDEIHEIVLVGGSTRIPKIQDMLQEYFGGRQLCKALNPDEAVAYGAAVQGAILSGRRNKKTDDLLLMDVTPLSLGIETTGRVMSVIIPRNTPIPCVRTQTYTTEHNYQTSVDIPIYEGERLNSDGNNLLGEFTITGIERAKRGEPQIDVSFSIDSNGILDVNAKDRKTNAQAKIQIKNRGKMGDEDIKRMVSDAEKYRRADEQRLKRVSARNEFEQTIIEALDVAEDLSKKQPKLAEIIRKAAEKEQQWLDELNDSIAYTEITSHRRALERRIQAQRE